MVGSRGHRYSLQHDKADCAVPVPLEEAEVEVWSENRSQWHEPLMAQL